MGGALTEQEFVAHLFAPLEGPQAFAALGLVNRLWAACRDQLGMSGPIEGTYLPMRIPADPASAPEGALAGLQDPAVNFQAIVRREHDVLNLSLVMATPANPRRRLGVGAAVPPGWQEYTRWWRALTPDGLGDLLGGATLYLAKLHDPAADIRAELPPQDDDAQGWWNRGSAVDGLPFWEVTAGGDRAMRRLVLLARKDEDVRLSELTWSTGDVALPPLGRYLMHAAKLRYQARVRGDGRQLQTLRDETAQVLDHLAGTLQRPAAPDEIAAEAVRLAAVEAKLAGTLEAIESMARTVEIARSNMASALPGPLPADDAFGKVFRQQLDDDAHYLATTMKRAAATRVPTVVTPPPLVQPPKRAPRVEQRLGFGIDVVKYSDRTVPQQADIQERLGGLVERILGDLGLEVADTDRQDAGDGLMMVLPPGQEVHRILPGLLNGWRARLVADNAAHPGDRIRLRLSVAAGPFAPAAIGFTGHTIIEMGRMLDSRVLRDAMEDHGDADVVALISDRLHQDVVREGHAGLDPSHFEEVEVVAKTYRATAWLWAGAPVARVPVAAVKAEPSDREVFVIHGNDDNARSALFGFLRAIGLHPLEEHELAARTESVAPRREDVLAQALAAHRAVIVLVTPADGPGLLLEAGLALAHHPNRTIIIEMGGQQGLLNRGGLHLDGTDIRPLYQLVQLLRQVGYAVEDRGTDWLDLKRFR